MANIRFEKVNKIYDNGFHAVYDFDLEIKEGEFIVFVGPSGCGKSTMLRTIAGLEEISNGKIYIDGEVINNKSPKERGIAMVFQSYALYPHLNVYENMSFGLKLEGYDQDYIDKRVQTTARILGLESYLERKPRELSGGQCQRVAVGRAIIRKPKVFLMDEPLSNLDAKQRASMRNEIIEIHRKTNATTIYVTHDQIEAMTMADRIVIMRDGVVQQIGTPHELYFQPANRFVAGFIGEPPMNFVDCTVEGGAFKFRQADVSLSADTEFADTADGYEGKDIILGFRPEAIEMQEPTAAADYYKLEGQVGVTELLGDSANAYVEIGGHNVILKTAPHLMPKEYTPVTFYVPKTKVYLFDADTKEAIARK